jgi:CheY-like chemotaxis protein
MPYRILIADDDLEDLELMEDAILNAAQEVELHKFTNALTAMEFLNSRADNEVPNLIILDYNMPELNGGQLLLSLRASDRYNTVPKVILSTSNAPLHKRECMNNGATEYIVKPDNMKDLYIIAEKLLRLCGNQRF